APVFARQMRKAADDMQRASEGMTRHQQQVKLKPEDTAAPAEAMAAQKSAQRRLQQLLDALKMEEGQPLRAQGANRRPPSGGGGAAGDRIPPLAQLKLLRVLQADVNERTREFARKHPEEDKLTEGQKKELRAIQ